MYISIQHIGLPRGLGRGRERSGPSDVRLPRVPQPAAARGALRPLAALLACVRSQACLRCRLRGKKTEVPNVIHGKQLLVACTETCDLIYFRTIRLLCEYLLTPNY